jgi:hypothetical protein
LLSPWRWRRYFPSKRRLLQEPYCSKSNKTAFYIERQVCRTRMDFRMCSHSKSGYNCSESCRHLVAGTRAASGTRIIVWEQDHCVFIRSGGTVVATHGDIPHTAGGPTNTPSVSIMALTMWSPSLVAAINTIYNNAPRTRALVHGFLGMFTFRTPCS